MLTPIRSFKFVGMEIHEYKHAENPSISKELEDRYYNGYLEIQILFTSEHWFINPHELRVLLVRPIDGTDQMVCEGNLIVMTLGPLEQYYRFEHIVDHKKRCDCGIGADIFGIVTKKLNEEPRARGFSIPHTKGILIPEEMLTQ